MKRIIFGEWEIEFDVPATKEYYNDFLVFSQCYRNYKKFCETLTEEESGFLLELQSCDNPERYREVVLYGCLHNTTYDAQCEGDRGWYMYQEIKLIDDKEAFESATSAKTCSNVGIER